MFKDFLAKLGKVVYLLFKKRLKQIKFEIDTDKIKELSAEGLITYTINTGGLLEYWALNFYLQENGLPPAKLLTGLPNIFSLPFLKLFRRFYLLFLNRKKYYSKLFRQAKDYINNQHGIVINFKEYVRTKRHLVPPSERIIKYILNYSKKYDKNIYFCPIVVIWIRRTKVKNKRFVDWLYGRGEDPNWLKKIWIMLYNYKMSIIKSPGIISALDYRQERLNQPIKAIAKSLRRKIITGIRSEQKLTMGPVKMSFRIIRDYILDNPEIQQLIMEISSSENISTNKLYKRSLTYIKEMAADFNFSYLEVLRKIVGSLIEKIYEGFYFDEADAKIIRETSKLGPTIIVPSHKSYMDFLVFSNLIYQSGIVPPHVIAGNNFSFWPAGRILKRCGAIFIKRSFRDNILYSQILRKYLQFLVTNGHSIEFFIEGKRSRTGKLLRPKYGIISMLYDAYNASVKEDMYFIPIALCFDQIADVKAYQEEHQGKEKTNESVKGLFNSKKIFKNKYGKVYVKVAQPINYKDIIAKVKITTSDINEQKKNSVQMIASEIMYAMNDGIIITPNALTCLILLSTMKKAVSSEKFDDYLQYFYEYIKAKKLKVSNEMNVKFFDVIENAIKLLDRNKLISKLEDIYIIEEKKRGEANYYKNNIIHIFLNRIFILIVLKKIYLKNEINYNNFNDYLKELFVLFKYDFIYPEENILKEDIKAELSLLFQCSSVDVNEIFENEVNEKQLEKILIKDGNNILPQALFTFFESYYILFFGINEILNNEKSERKEIEIDEKVFLTKMSKNAYKMHLVDEIKLIESISAIIFRNAFDYLCDLGITSIRKHEDHSQEKKGSIFVIHREKKKEIVDLISNLNVTMDIISTDIKKKIYLFNKLS